MAQIEAQDVVTYFKEGRGPSYSIYLDMAIDKTTPVKDIEEALSRLRDLAMKNKQRCKTNRPWNIVNLQKELDPEQAWIGFEYETGFDNQKDYEQAIAFLWDTQRYNAIDREGSGKFPFEVAFPPCNAEDMFVNKTSNMQKYFEFIWSKGMKQANNPTTYTCRAIGMHVNISTPLSRKNDGHRYADYLRDWIGKMTKEQHIELFGRHQVFWAYAQQRAAWVEFKVFKSTDDKDAVTGYIAVTEKLAGLLDYVSDGLPPVAPSNLYEYLSGKDAALKRGK